MTPEPRQLAQAEAAVGGDEDQGAVRGSMASARRATSAGSRKRISWTSTLGSGTRRQGERAITPASTAAPIALPRSWYALRTVAGERPEAESSTTQLLTSSWPMSASRQLPKRGTT
ncbi:MAG: hypothetical protein M3N68_04245 [Actinomycetota bacterium]|nr:hypothetical protein [Actinomycetota bacterium]